MTSSSPRRWTIGLSLAALAVAGTAWAADPAPRAAAVTRADAQTHASAMFTRLDVNQDGKIDAADRSARQSQMFDRMDADHNGQISREEFAAAHQRGPATAAGAPAGGAHEGHRMAGHGDGHGGGHRAERRGRHRPDGAMLLLRAADANGDSAVSQAEFSAAALQRFDRADANHDGTLTREERRAAHRAMRAGMRGNGPAGQTPPPPAGQ